MKKLYYYVVFIFIFYFINLFSVDASASTLVYRLFEDVEMGTETDVNVFFPNNGPNVSYVSENTEIAEVEDGKVYAYQPGVVNIYMYNANGYYDLLELTVTMSNGIYRMRSSDCFAGYFISTISNIVEGASVTQAEYSTSGMSAIRQLWRVTRCDGTENSYCIRPYFDSSSYLIYNGENGEIYMLDSVNGEGEDISNHIYNEWIIGNPALKIKSKNFPNQFLYYNFTDKKVYSKSEAELGNLSWYFYKENQPPVSIKLIDMLDENSEVNIRYMEEETNKTQEELKVWLGLCYPSDEEIEIYWSSSNGDVASVNTETGDVTSYGPGTTTITAMCTIDSIVYSSSYTLKVVTFCDGIYNIKNTYNQEYLSASTGSNNAIINTVASGEGEYCQWYVDMLPNGEVNICLVNTDTDNRLALSYTYEDEGQALNLIEVSQSAIPSYSINWLIDEDGETGNYHIMYSDIIGSYIDITSDNELVRLSGTGNSNSNLWEFVYLGINYYSKQIDMYYNSSFKIRYSTNYKSIMQNAEYKMRQAFLTRFGLNFVIYSYTEHASCADRCIFYNTGKLSLATIENMCPNNASEKELNCLYAGADGGDCTGWYKLATEFHDKKERTSILFCGHSQYNDSGQVSNRSFSMGKVIIMLGYDTESMADTLIHEMGHQLDVRDHYHEMVIDSETGEIYCKSGIRCSCCGIASYRRNKTCVMNGVYTTNYQFCEACETEIIRHLNYGYVIE